MLATASHGQAELQSILRSRTLAELTPGEAYTGAKPFGHHGDRAWHEVRTLPEGIYREFLGMPRANVGYMDLILDRRRPQDGRVITMVDIRERIAVIFFRGVPGGTGFAVPEDCLYADREYLLEIRWFDCRDDTWKVWWNRERLDGSLLDRPGLYPQAHNAPF